MMKRYAAIAAAIIMMSLTACGTFAPPQATETTTTTTTAEVTTVPSVTTVPADNSEPATTTKVTMSEEEKKQIATNTFIAEFFDSAITFEDKSALTKEVQKKCPFEHSEESTNGLQRISLKGDNGSGTIDVLCIDISNSDLDYDLGYIVSTFGDYYYGFTVGNMQGVTEDNFTTNYRLTNTVVSKGKYQQYGSLQKSDGMANQFGYAETYAVLVNSKLTLVSGQFLSTDMMERQSFTGLMAAFRDKIPF
ncbi:MAG: hypothetical protein IJ740_17220 [Ruminococcus sp.]|nr:hypothetical protein [Ruminococcus sp.]